MEGLSSCLLLPFKILFFHKFLCQSSWILYLASSCPLYLSYWYDNQCLCVLCLYTHALIVHSQIRDSNHTHSSEWLVIVRVPGQQTLPNCLQYQKWKPYKMNVSFLSPVQSGRDVAYVSSPEQGHISTKCNNSSLFHPVGDPTHLPSPHLLSCPFCSASVATSWSWNLGISKELLSVVEGLNYTHE